MLHIDWHQNSKIKNDIKDQVSELIKTLPFFKQFENSSCEIDTLEAISNQFLKRKVIIIGTGGSIMTAKTFRPLSKNDNITLVDNIDPDTCERLMRELDSLDTKPLFIFISKSGTTTEILMLAETILNRYKNIDSIIITESTDNPLRQIPNALFIEHPKDIGGRFSAFTPVGILPCLLMGLNPHSFYNGAKKALKDFFEIGFMLPDLSKTQHVLLAYCDNACGLLEWFRQLIAESLGKINSDNEFVGITPITAQGTLDQHSQLQLYLDGPKDKFITVITCRNTLKCPSIDEPKLMQKLKGHRIDDLYQMQSKATIEALLTRNIPVRSIKFDAFDEYHIGYFMIHAVIEMLGLSIQMKVDPLDQPAVEIGKKLVASWL